MRSLDEQQVYFAHKLHLRCMMDQLPDELGIVGAKIVYDTGLVVEVNKINDKQLFISGLSNSSDGEVAKTVKL